ncbi:hypothetical protein GCM10018771_70890 [Streptomyces cellulosae]|nr:hypothetical protein GCM10018771_70890 [Streptomyces cellulosae]
MITYGAVWLSWGPVVPPLAADCHWLDPGKAVGISLLEHEFARPPYGRRPGGVLAAFLEPGPPGAGDPITTTEEHGCT